MKTYRELNDETEELEESAIIYGNSAISHSKIKSLGGKVVREKLPHKRDILVSKMILTLAWMIAINTSFLSREITKLKEMFDRE